MIQHDIPALGSEMEGNSAFGAVGRPEINPNIMPRVSKREVLVVMQIASTLR